MSPSLRTKLALALALVAAVPLVAIQQLSSALMRREFEVRTEAEFDSLRGLIEARFAGEGKRLGGRVGEIARGYELRAALLAFAASGKGPSQLELIRALASGAAREGLGLLTLYGEDGRVLGSAQEPNRFDVLDPVTIQQARAYAGKPVLAREEGVAVTGLALRTAVALDETAGRYWLVGGTLVDDAFLGTLPVPEPKTLVLVGPTGIRVVPPRGGREARSALADLPAAGDVAAEAGRRLVAAGFRVAVVDLPGVVNEARESILLATSRRPLEATLTNLQRSFAALLLAGLAVAAMLAWLIARRYTEPIDQLVRGLDRVAHGDLDWRIGDRSGDEGRTDEMGRLLRAFHAMTRDLAESRERLIHSERIAAWRDIARRLAHEIKNPLSPIALSMETLRRSYAAGRPDFPEHLAESTRTVLEEVERLRRIVQEFSDFARLPAPKRIEDSFHDVLRGVVSLFSAGADRLRFDLDLAPGEARLVFDPDQMNRMLVNLVKNAVEAMPEGGVVRVRTRFDEVRLRFVLTVEDEGPGVPLEAARRLFDPYVTTKPGGTGLGLAIVHRIVSEHEGTVRLANPGERGARFVVELPAAG